VTVGATDKKKKHHKMGRHSVCRILATLKAHSSPELLDNVQTEFISISVCLNIPNGAGPEHTDASNIFFFHYAKSL
jgi:hypothetical protein